MTITQKTPQAPHHRLYDLLSNASTADKVTVHFRDGRVAHGCLAFNERRGTGRVIDPEKELSIDFEVNEIRDLKFG